MLGQHQSALGLSTKWEVGRLASCKSQWQVLFRVGGGWEGAELGGVKGRSGLGRGWDQWMPPPLNPRLDKLLVQIQVTHCRDQGFIRGKGITVPFPPPKETLAPAAAPVLQMGKGDKAPGAGAPAAGGERVVCVAVRHIVLAFPPIPASLHPQIEPNGNRGRVE